MTFFRLLERFGSARAAIEALPSLSQTRSALIPAARHDVEREWQQTLDYGGTILCACEESYPRQLKPFDPPPPCLTVLGNLDLTDNRTVAIVGARQASAAGRKIARDLARNLSEPGFVIVSGLAKGIDGEAHAASLGSGTIAVLAGGIDHVYPRHHQDLYQAISNQGLIVSESPFGYRATARDFPRRNRIITGLSEGVIIIEAAARSGSLISARTALEQNREVLVVPGSPLDPRYSGSNELLRQGAVLIRDADDVIEALQPSLFRAARAPEPLGYRSQEDRNADTPPQQLEAVKAALSVTPVRIEEIAHSAGVSMSRCSAALVELELAGVARTYSGGLASLRV